MYIQTLFLLCTLVSIFLTDAAERVNQASLVLVQSETPANCLDSCPEDNRGSGR